MRLAVVGKENNHGFEATPNPNPNPNWKEKLTALKQLVTIAFGPALPRDYHSPPGVNPGGYVAPLGSPYPPSYSGRVVYSVPIKDEDSLSITWALPGTFELSRKKPLMYMAHLLGHEGAGSLNLTLTLTLIY